MTFTVNPKDFTTTVDAEGIIEAKKNHIIISPQISLVGYRTITYLAPEGSEVKKGELLVILHSIELEKNYKNAQDELEIAKAEAKQKEVQFKVDRLLQESQLRSLEASAAVYMLQLPKLEFAAPTEQEIKRLEIKKSEAQVKKISKKLSDLENIQKEERKYMEMKVKKAEGNLKKQRIFTEQFVIKSPSDGIVTYAINMFTDKKVQVGDLLYRGWPIVKIPDLSIMQVNMQISETESQRLKKGQKAIVTVSSMGDFRLTGKISEVGKVATPIKSGSKIKKMGVIVEIDSTNTELMPGLTAECSIIVEEFKNALVVPKECIFENDSINIVYIRDGGRFTPRPVELLHQSDDFVIIKNGLKGGEILSLLTPGSSFIKLPDSLKTVIK